MRSTIPYLFFASAIAAGSLGAPGPARAGEPHILGWAERVQVLPENLILRGKLDTGAHTTSIDAQRVSWSERDGRPWVRFSLSDRKGREQVLERPVVRVVRIMRSGIPTVVRPVVLLSLCLGGKFREEAVTLANRSHLRYPLLIGRSTMTGKFIVDSSRKYTAKRACFDR